jgi:Deoxynucleoside kinase
VVLALMERYQGRQKDSTVTVYEQSVRAAREVFIERFKEVLAIEDLTFLSELCAVAESEFERNVSTVYLTCSDVESVRRFRERDRQSEKSLR